MYVLPLLFVLFADEPKGAASFERRELVFASQESCREAMSWWLAHPDAELDGMDARFRLLTRPVPAWDCAPRAERERLQALAAPR